MVSAVVDRGNGGPREWRTWTFPTGWRLGAYRHGTLLENGQVVIISGKWRKEGEVTDKGEEALPLPGKFLQWFSLWNFFAGAKK